MRETAVCYEDFLLNLVQAAKVYCLIDGCSKFMFYVLPSLNLNRYGMHEINKIGLTNLPRLPGASTPQHGATGYKKLLHTSLGLLPTTFGYVFIECQTCGTFCCVWLPSI